MRRIRSWERFKWASEVKTLRGEKRQQFLKDTAELLAPVRGSPGRREELTPSLLPTNNPGHITPHTSGVCKYMGGSEIYRRVSVKRQSQLRDPVCQHDLSFHRILSWSLWCFFLHLFFSYKVPITAPFYELLILMLFTWNSLLFSAF